jgi:hypothetical protein
MGRIIIAMIFCDCGSSTCSAQCRISPEINHSRAPRNAINDQDGFDESISSNAQRLWGNVHLFFIGSRNPLTISSRFMG